VNLKEVIPLFTAAVFFVGAVYPKAIFLKISREPHPQQLITRLCLGLLALWWYAMEA